MSQPASCGNHLVSQQTVQILTVAALGEWLSQSFKLCGINEPLTPGHFLGTRYFQPLTVLQRGNELARVQQAVVRASSLPRWSTVKG